MIESAENVVKGMFEPSEGLGRVRLREHRPRPKNANPDEFTGEMPRMLRRG
jgi:hypothetical protein